jgi:hypothetical protein
MHRHMVAIVTALLCAACSRTHAPSPADSAAIAKRFDDSIIARRTSDAPLFADSARHVMVTLLKHPATAVFDSLVVVQPAKVDGVWPAPVVCARLSGRPGINGGHTPVPFIYQNRLDVFVLQQDNGSAFAALRARTCGNPSARVLLGDTITR